MAIDNRLNVSETLLSQLYNREYKELFLKEYLEDNKVRESYVVYLNIVSQYEQLIQRDAYQWSEKDIKDFFSSQMTSSHTSLRACFSILKQYLNYCTGRGFNIVGSNPFSALSFKKDILPMLNVRGLQNKYISEEELWMIADEAKNYQDSCPLICSFYSFKKDELINLKRDDVDVINNKVTLKNRTIELPKKVIDLILKTDGEDVYYKMGDPDTMKKPYGSLVDSEYVIKPTMIGNRDGSNQVKAQTIANRVKKLLVNAGYENLSINDIITSGKLESLKKIEKGTGKEPTINDYKLVNDSFGDSMENYSNLKTLYELAVSKAD